MKLTLQALGDFPRLRDDEGKHWNPFEAEPDNERLDYDAPPCVECGGPVFRGYRFGDPKIGYQHICPDCVELDIPAHVVKVGL